MPNKYFSTAVIVFFINDQLVPVMNLNLKFVFPGGQRFKKPMYKFTPPPKTYAKADF